jgi:CTP synthase
MNATGEHETKYIFVTGGVVSALGKGIVAASLGRLLKERGLRVQAQKFDPYLNVDPGTMSPFQHGEVFVTEDGAETDLDIGHYERFIDENLSRNASHSAGAIWDAVLRKERKGEFLGATVQVIPHITNEIKLRIKRAAKAAPADVVISEIGGTVGDIESLPFLEAIRQFRREVGPENVMYLHCTLVPFIEAAGELKTKPTQHSVNELRRIGIHPDVIVCRSHEELSQDIKDKIALFADVDIRSVIAAPDVSDVYLVPAVLREEGLDDLVCAQLGIDAPRAGLGEWQEVIDRIGEPREPVTIALVGKYVKLHDAYLSVHEALKHAGVHQGAAVRVQWVDAENMSYEETAELLEQVDGVLVPGGFGSRGWEGKILACQVARERGIPYLGICLGMHVAVSEFARNVAGFDGANSTEMDPETPYPVIDLLPEQKEIEDLGGTMRLGAQAVELAEGTRTREVYGDAVIHERHRHRYEVNNQYREQLIDAGLVVSGTFQEGRLVEVIELPDHPWFVASQFHPEFKSRPTRPAPLFREFVGAAMERARSRNGLAQSAGQHVPM